MEVERVKVYNVDPFTEIGSIPLRTFNNWRPNMKVRHSALTDKQKETLSYYLKREVSLAYAFFSTNRVYVGMDAPYETTEQ